MVSILPLLTRYRMKPLRYVTRELRRHGRTLRVRVPVYGPPDDEAVKRALARGMQMKVRKRKRLEGERPGWRE